MDCLDEATVISARIVERPLQTVLGGEHTNGLSRMRTVIDILGLLPKDLLLTLTTSSGEPF